jgi:transposase
MLTLLPTVRVFLGAGATDMRKSFDGLAEIVKRILEHDPLSGHLFAFCNRQRTRLKILYWDGSGFWVLHKRVESGTLAWPKAVTADQRSIEMSASELGMLVSGLDITQVRRRGWYSRTPTSLVEPQKESVAR